jgi:CheY-like chemotaxis protein
MGKTILVIEDEEPLLIAIKAKLEKCGFSVVTARSVEQATGYLEDVKPISAVWLDHYLLGLEDGLDFVTQCKAEGSRYRETPIFVVSNTASPEKVQSYLKLGVTKYYAKAEKRLDEIISEIDKEVGKNGE